MTNIDDFILNSKTYKFFDKSLLKDKEIRDTLISFEELLNIKKNIRSMYETDDPKKIKTLIGKEINGVVVTEKDFDYTILISNTYKNLYAKCKKILEDNKL